MKDSAVYTLIFATSLAYAPALTWWHRRDPIGFANNTWLTVVIGVGYTILYLRLLLSPRAWFRLCAAFFFASLPIIARSLLQNANHNRKFNQFTGGGGHV